jgi:hypothetical protein
LAPTLNQAVSTLRFFFRVTLSSSTHFIHEARKLTVVLSPEEVARLFDAARAACRDLKACGPNDHVRGCDHSISPATSVPRPP